MLMYCIGSSVQQKISTEAVCYQAESLDSSRIATTSSVVMCVLCSRSSSTSNARAIVQLCACFSHAVAVPAMHELLSYTTVSFLRQG